MKNMDSLYELVKEALRRRGFRDLAQTPEVVLAIVDVIRELEKDINNGRNQ